MCAMGTVAFYWPQPIVRQQRASPLDRELDQLQIILYGAETYRAFMTLIAMRNDAACTRGRQWPGAGIRPQGKFDLSDGQAVVGRPGAGHRGEVEFDLAYVVAVRCAMFEPAVLSVD